MKEIKKDIFHIESTNIPWSSDCVVVSDDFNYVFDCGNNIETSKKINELDNIVLIISHFHKDHVGEIDNINYKKLYISNNTYKKINKGEKIKSIELGKTHKIKVFELSSCHCKGSLVMLVDDILFVADALYPKYKYNNIKYYTKSLLRQTIIELNNIDFKYLYMSHKFKKIKKEVIINYLNKMYLEAI